MVRAGEDGGEHDLERVSDWLLYSPCGLITPKSQAAARRVRADFDWLKAKAASRAPRE